MRLQDSEEVSRMKVWMERDDFERLEEYQKEGRSAEARISVFRIFETDIEIECELKRLAG